MIILEIPDNPLLIGTVGKVAIRHGQLDYVLRMTVKSILNLSIPEALNATSRQGSRELRDRIRKLARKKFGEGEVLVKLDALLNRAHRATSERNNILHSLWAYKIDEGMVIRDDDQNFRPIPDIADLEMVANNLAAIASELNEARLEGFLKRALEECN